MPAQSADWTKGPAKFLAAGSLGGAAVVGLVWALTSTSTPEPSQQTPPPAIIAPQPITNQHSDTTTQPTTPQPALSPTPTPSSSPPAPPPASVPTTPDPAPPATPETTQPPSPAPTPTPAPTIARKINLNTASTAELESLPGIGPALAKRILDHRTAKGPFRRIEDLDAVSGIGPKTLERLRPFITTE